MIDFGEFERQYPGRLFGWTSTADGLMPWRLFLLFNREIPRMEARQMRQQALAVALAIGMKFGGGETAVRELNDAADA